MKMNLYGKMNVTEAHLEKIGQNQPLGDQIALEQIDDKTKSIENKFIDILEHEKEENDWQSEKTYIHSVYDNVQ